MPVIEALREKHGFSRAEAELADFLLSHADEAVHMSMRELAASSCKSNGTIVRLCRNVGSTGWKELRVDLAADVERVRAASRGVNPDMPFRGRVSTQAAMHSIVALKKEALDDCYASIASDQVHALAEAIMQSRIVTFYAHGESYLTAQSFGALIAKMGVMCVPADQYHSNNASAYHATPNDLALFVTYSGRMLSRHKLQIDTLRTRGCKIALVTANVEEAKRLQGFGQALIVPSRESTYGKVATFYSQECLRYALECVYAVAFAKNYGQNLHDKDMIEMQVPPHKPRS